MNDFTAINNYFDHIYIITLPRAKERQDEIAKHLAGLQYEFFFGADKRDHSVTDMVRDGIYDETMSKKNHRYHKTFNSGQICCAWSHKKVYADILDKGYQKVLVLEDDVIPAAGIGKLSQLVLAALPSDWDLIYFDYNKNENRNILKQYWYHVQRFWGGLSWSHTTIRNLYPKNISRYLASAGFHDFTSAYAITAHAAQRLLALQTPIAYLADNLLAIACTTGLIRGFIARPKLFSQLSQGPDRSTGSFVDD